MPDGSEQISVRVAERISAISPAEWDACAGDDDPFLSHAFLGALEETGCVSAESGWLPHHLAVDAPDGGIMAVAPLYVKGHSQGEYVFDWGWADAYERAGGRYYPKLQCAVPFTPVPGRRLLAKPGPNAAAAEMALAAGIEELSDRHGLSSAHVTFLPEDQAASLGERGWLVRHGMQFHWRNRGYRNFDDFLGALMSRKRKSIAKERRSVADAGIRTLTLCGDEIMAHHWDAFHRFYVDTYDRKWGYPYLNREFFELLTERLGNRVVLVMAEQEGRLIAGALNLRGTQALYGRNWGADGDYRFLHFEACYYSAIDFAIEHGLERVEAGTQGPHKVQRGYEPIRTYSAHLIRDPGLRAPVADFIRRESRQIAHEMEAMAGMSPYRRDET
ncbi:MAG: GNAT family N-acetyltransferase [Alphaproteobacteria bacterium]|nr:GNAT family N-acetyltransferase [Alphaproteobacteria bacterium]